MYHINKNFIRTKGEQTNMWAEWSRVEIRLVHPYQKYSSTSERIFSGGARTREERRVSDEAQGGRDGDENLSALSTGRSTRLGLG